MLRCALSVDAADLDACYPLYSLKMPVKSLIMSGSIASTSISGISCINRFTIWLKSNMGVAMFPSPILCGFVVQYINICTARPARRTTVSDIHRVWGLWLSIHAKPICRQMCTQMKSLYSVLHQPVYKGGPKCRSTRYSSSSFCKSRCLRH